MFTGIVECMGRVVAIQPQDKTETGGNGWTITIGEASSILNDCKLGDSISVNGTCLTVTEFNKDSFKVGLSPETLRRTNLGQLKVGHQVNLERALSANTRFGGHFVQGHVDGTCTVLSVTPDGNSIWYKLQPSDARLMRYIIPKGYVALDGTSLTVCEVHDPTQSGTIKKDIKGEQGPWFTVMLIAYTQAHVVLPQRQPGDLVNLEVDMLGKYVERVLTGALTEANDEASSSSSSSTSGVKQYVDQLVTRLVNQRLAERSK